MLRSKSSTQPGTFVHFIIARDCFDELSKTSQTSYMLSASFAVNFLMDIEPRLANDIGETDILQLEILSDDCGKDGDVRDVLAIRVLQKWEIGVSAKNNHQAVKHSRLSNDIDFGAKWIGIPCSKDYFDNIFPIFSELKKLREESGKQKKWSELGDYHISVYRPILQAFVLELKRIYTENPLVTAQNLASYLLGNKDFYKVIQSKGKIDIYAYNLHGTLNQVFQTIQPKYQTPKITLPTQITSIDLKSGSNNTVIVEMDNDWTLSFRIHNASSRIEASLKFDITLIKSPKTLFKNTLRIL